MGREHRRDFDYAYHHVMNRVSAKRMIFKNAVHCMAFFKSLEHVVKTDEIQVHAYCLMGNHFHLLLRTPNNNLSEAMQRLSSMFTKRFNRIQKIDGPLFRGRFKSLLIGHDDYMRQLCRYIHRNPVAAGLVKLPQHYEWSSYRAYAGIAEKPDWLTTDDMPRFFLNAEVGLRSFVETEASTELDGLGPDELFKHLRQQDENHIPVPSLCLQRPYVDRSFKWTPAGFVDVIKEVAMHYDVTQVGLLSRTGTAKNTPRDVSMFLARKEGRMKLTDIAEAFKITESAASIGIARLKSKIQIDNQLKSDIDQLQTRIQTYREKIPAWIEVKP